MRAEAAAAKAKAALEGLVDARVGALETVADALAGKLSSAQLSSAESETTDTHTERERERERCQK
jgi:hypothetical protein